jgi:hypothetical protein
MASLLLQRRRGHLASARALLAGGGLLLSSVVAVVVAVPQRAGAGPSDPPLTENFVNQGPFGIDASFQSQVASPWGA